MIAGIVAGLTGVGSFVAGILLNVGAGIYLSAKQFDLGREQRGFIINNVSSLSPVPVIYGRARTGLRIVDQRVDPNDENQLYIVGAICDGGMRTGASGGISDFREIWFDDRMAVNAAGTVQSPFAGKLTVTEYKGTDVQTVDSTLNTKFSSEWPTTSKGHGVAYLIFKLTYDEKVYPTGLPNITVIVDGVQVWDLTLGTPAWAWRDNPALCIRDLLMSTRYGPGAAAGEIDDTEFEAEADYCDELVNIPDGASGWTTQKRFTCNGIMDTAKPWQENLDRLLSSCRGILIFQYGKFRLYIPKIETAETFELDESNIIGDWEWHKGGFSEVCNIMEATFIDTDIEYRPNIARYPQIGVSNSFLTNDNDFEARRKIDLPFTNNIYMAEHLLDTLLKETRNDITCSVTTKEEATKLQVGNVVKVTHETPGFAAKKFRVMGVGFMQDGNLRMLLKEYADATYSLGSQTDAAVYPDSNLPNPYWCVSATGLAWESTVTEALETNSGKIPRAMITWNHSADPYLQHEDLFFKVNGTSDWLFVKRVQSTEVAIAYIAELDAGGSYDVGVRATNTISVQSSLVTLMNQTAYDPDAYDPGQGDPPTTPSLVVLTAEVNTRRVID